MSNTSPLLELELLRSQVADLSSQLAARDRLVQDLREQSSLLPAIVLATATETGEEFFEALVTQLTSLLKVQYAVIGEVQGGHREKIRTLAVSSGGALVENFEYDIADTPCAIALTQTFACFDRDVQATFPQFQRSADLEVDSYCAVPLQTKGGAVFGLLVVMDTKPIHNGHYLQSLLGVFAPRIVAEIERKRADQERLQALYDLRNITETIPDVMFTLDTQGNLVKCNRRLGDLTGCSPEELLNKPALVFVPAEERARTAAAFQRTFTEGHVELDGHLLNKDFRTIPYHWIGDLLKSPHGEVIGITAVGRDVSDKKRKEAELRRQRRHLVDTQALAHLGSWNWDVTTGEVQWSDEQFRIFGHEPGSISVTYDTFIASLHPADQAIIEAAFNDALLGKCVYNVEYRVVRPNGEVRFVHARGDVHRDVTGSPLSMAGTVLDITERHQAETALRDQEQLLRTVIETATDAIYMKDAEGRYVLINSAGVEVIGKPVNQIVGRDDRELFPTEVATRLMADDRQVLAGFEQARFEAIFSLTGESRTFYTVKTPHRDRQGKVIGLVGVSRDVTELLKQADERLRQSEERYRVLYDDTPTMYFTLATDGTVRSVNRFGAEQLGYQVEELVGHSVLGVFYDEDKESVAASLSECLATPETTRHWEFRKVRKDGTVIWVRETARVGQSSTGETVVLVNCEDITEHRRMEEALAQLNATLEQQVNDRTEALRSSEERLKQAVEVADLGIFEHDHSADTIEISTRLRAMYGWDTESPISLQEIIACVFPLDREGLAAAIKLAHDPAGDGCLAHEHRVVWSDGSMHWLSVRAQTWFAGDGSDRRPSRTLGAVCNITERKKAEEALAQVNVVLEKEVVNRTRDLFQSEQAIRALHEATAAPGLSFDERMQAVLEVGCRRFSLPIGMLTRVVDEKLEFTHVYAPGTTFTAGMTVPLDVSYCKTPLQVADPTCFEQAGASVCRNHLEYKALGLECYLWTEMIGQDRLYGTVCFADHPPRLAAFSQADKDFLQLMARWISGELDRRMAELALKQSEERYRALYDDTPTMYFTLGKDGIVLSVNRFGAEQLGYRVEELVGHSVLDVFYDEDKETVAASLSECLATPELTRHWEFRKVRKDGTIIWVQETVHVGTSSSGETIVLVTCEDITERKRVEDRLRATQYAVDHATDYIFVIGSNGYFLDVNESACHRLGYTKAELLTKSVMDIDPDFPATVWESFWEEFKQKKLLRYETRHCSKFGEVYPVEVVASYILHEGKELNYAFVRDITERKKAEAELRKSHAFVRQIIDTDPNFIFAKDREGRFTLVNKAVADVYGTTVENLIGKTDADFNPNQEEVAFFRQKDLAVMNTLQELFLPEEVITDSGGRTRWLQIVKRPLLDDEGRATMVLGAATDITDRKRMEEKLRQRERDLQAALQERERISQELHDGILQSLFAVGLTLETTKSMLPPRNRKKSGAPLDQAIMQLNLVMQEIRNFIAGLGSDLLKGKDLPVVLQHMLASLTQNQATRVRLSVEDRAANAVSAEQSLHLLRIIQEAVSNCIRHGHAKEVRVSLKVLEKSVRLSIRDNGRGFEPVAAQGTGHGLSNMAARAQKIGGRFTVSSKVNEGTRIVLDLPKETSYASR